MGVPQKYVLCEPWVIHEVDTMNFIGDYRSGTHYNPVPASRVVPKFFPSVRSAEGFIAQWRRGKINSWGEDGLDCTPIPSRKNVKFEIIQLQLVRVP